MDNNEEYEEEEVEDDFQVDPALWARLRPDERVIIKWHLKRRPEQICPTPRPFIWMLRGGRGSGKTYTAAQHIFEYARELALTLPKDQEHDIIRVALVGDTFSDVQKTMCEGATGLLSIIPSELVHKWNRATTELWVNIPSAGRQILFSGYTSQVPGKLRGPQQHAAWIDEPGKFNDADADPMGKDSTWSNLLLGTRLGKEVNAPHIVVTGTPTPCKLINYLENHDESTISFMTTWQNIDNLPDSYRKELEGMNKNSRTYRQEIMAEILTDNPDAVFSDESINLFRYEPDPDPTTSFRVPGSPRIEQGKTLFKVIGWDPAVGIAEDGDEAGIVVAGFTPEIKQKARGRNGKGRPAILETAQAYILEDLSAHISPYDQANLVIDTILEQKIEDLVCEINQGSATIVQMLTQVLKEKTYDFTIRLQKGKKREDYGSIQRYVVRCVLLSEDGEKLTHNFTINAIHASKNKKVRAEVASVAYDQGKVHHPEANTLPTCEKDACQSNLETQMTSWNPNTTRSKSPDRMDALVYCVLFIFGYGGSKSSTTLVNKLTGSTPNQEEGLREDQQVLQQQRTNHRHSSIWSADVSGRGFVDEGRLVGDPDGWWNKRVI